MRHRNGWMTRALVPALACLMLAVVDAAATTRTVTKTADTDDGVCNADCSLREAIDVSASGDQVVFSALFNSPQTIALVFGGLTIFEGIDVVGPGADLLTIAGSAGTRGITVWSNVGNVMVTLSGMTITGAGFTGIVNLGDVTVEDCVVAGNDESGITNLGDMVINNSTITENTGGWTGVAGGIVNHHTLTLTNSTVSNNGADDTSSGAGGIFNDGFLTVVNSTISGNSKSGGTDNGGGIYHSGTTTITNSTITNNRATGAGSASGVFKEFFAGAVTVGSTIIAANVNNATKPDVVESSFGFSSDGFNLIGNVGTATGFTSLGDQVGSGAAPLDPLLDPLGDYGGSTQTHRLQVNSTAIDKGYSFGLTTDQRGFTRPFDKSSVPNVTGGDGSDIGAYELQFSVTIVGRAFDPFYNPLRGGRVVVRLANGHRWFARTDRFGVYRVDHVPRNRTVTVSVTHRRYEFTPRVVRVKEQDITDLDFIALPR